MPVWMGEMSWGTTPGKEPQAVNESSPGVNPLLGIPVLNGQP